MTKHSNKKSPLSKEAREENAIELDARNAEREQEEAEASAQAELDALPPIICLGEEGTKNVYWSRVNGNIYKHTPTEHTANYLRRMACLEDYAKWLHPEYDKEQVQNNKRAILAEAGERLLEETAGEQFDSERTRGRGVWKDSLTEGFVFNTGNGCYLLGTDGTPHKVSSVRGKHLYTREQAISPPHVTPLSYAEGAQVVEFLEARSWELKGSGSLMAGWCVCSLLAGVLPIRVHVWINSPTNQGKSHLRKHLELVLGEAYFKMDGAETTEAGLRADIKNDALGVVWDEIEQDAGDVKKGQNIKRIVALIRNATTGAIIKKGSSGGGAVARYRAMCCFLLFSISHSLENDSDANRFLQLRLRKASNTDVENLLKRQKEGEELVNREGFTARLITRALIELPFILSNVQALEPILRSMGLATRSASLFAVILASSHALAKGGHMTPDDMEQGKALVKNYKEKEEQREVDAMRLLNTILNVTTTVKGLPRNLRSLIVEVLKYQKGIKDGRDSNADISDILIALETYGIDLHLIEGVCYVRLFPHEFNARDRLKGTQWENGRLVPVLMDGETSAGSVSESGVILKKSKKDGSNPYTCVLIPPSLISAKEQESLE